MPTDPRILNAETPEEFDSQNASIAFDQLKKIVIGKLDGDPQKFDGTDKLLSQEMPALTHLYLWGINDLKALTGWNPPDTLVCLEIRNCPNLESLPALTNGLRELVVEDCGACTGWKKDAASAPDTLPYLQYLSFARSPGIPVDQIKALLGCMPELRHLDLSGQTEWESFDLGLVPNLVDLRLNGCSNLREFITRATLAGSEANIPHFPIALRHLELSESAIGSIPPFHWEQEPSSRENNEGGSESAEPGATKMQGLDYVDLQGTRNLRNLPDFVPDQFPRTLLLSESALELPPEILGGSGENVAQAVLAHLEGIASDRVTYHELKVILLGNGRAGKSSLAKKLVDGTFEKGERTTEGIALLTLPDFAFEPIDADATGERDCNATLRIWDFAGQDLYHNTHRLFFDSKAIFIICANCSGPGSDEMSDKNVKEQARKDLDQDHNLSYWLSQIMAETDGGTRAPKILFVRTKADRDDETKGKKNVEKKIQGFEEEWGRLNQVNPSLRLEKKEFSKDHGRDAVLNWLKGAVSWTLGKRGERQIQSNALKVKTELEEKQKKKVGMIKVEDFEEIVSRHCPGSAYAKDPELLISFFHNGGVLYRNKQHIPDWVILDQQWAINAVYVCLGWENEAWKDLVGRNGRCTLDWLKEKGWTEYPEETWDVFLRLMRACGIAVPLGRLPKGKQEYLIVNAAPKFTEDTEDRLSNVIPGFSAPNAELTPLSGPSVSKRAVLRLISILGSFWGAHGRYWSNAALIVYHPPVLGNSAPEQPTQVVLNWTPREKDERNYDGSLSVKRFGPNAEFVEAIKGATRSIPDLAKAVGSERGKEKAGDASLLQRFAPRGEVSAIEVGISYAGQFEPGSDQTGLVHTLRDELEQLGCGVFEYEGDGKLAEPDRNPQRRGYMDALVERDVVLVVLSEKYWKSPWCMYEFMRICERTSSPSGMLDGSHHGVSMRAFQDGYYSQEGSSGQGLDPDSLDLYWERKLDEFSNKVDPDGVLSHMGWVRRAKERFTCYAWYEWLDRNELRASPLVTQVFGEGAVAPVKIPQGQDHESTAWQWISDFIRGVESRPKFVEGIAWAALHQAFDAEKQPLKHGRLTKAWKRALELVCLYHELQRGESDPQTVLGENTIKSSHWRRASEILKQMDDGKEQDSFEQIAQRVRELSPEELQNLLNGGGRE